ALCCFPDRETNDRPATPPTSLASASPGSSLTVPSAPESSRTRFRSAPQSLPASRFQTSEAAASRAPEYSLPLVLLLYGVAGNHPLQSLALRALLDLTDLMRPVPLERLHPVMNRPQLGRVQ